MMIQRAGRSWWIGAGTLAVLLTMPALGGCGSRNREMADQVAAAQAAADRAVAAQHAAEKAAHEAEAAHPNAAPAVLGTAPETDFDNSFDEGGHEGQDDGPPPPAMDGPG
jgi:hypothetical protein